MDKLPNYHACFVCGDRNPAGLAVRFWTDGEKVWTRFSPSANHTGYHGATHGGILAALLDETMGWAPSLQNRRFCVSIELRVHYLKPVPIGAEVTVTGWTTSGQRRIWETEGEITSSDGTVYARGYGRYMPVSDEQTRNVVEYLTFDEGCVPVEKICRGC
jgi:uncharacterized protein (TIGR00369 family)